MKTIADVFNLYGDVIELKFAEIENNLLQILKPFDEHWTQYNKKKPHILRQGLSLTSLDGGLSGHPDLDSVKEYNEIHGVQLDEPDFNVRTSVVKTVPSVERVMDAFSSLGRSHFIKFGAGGFFPFHRDGNFSMPANSFRVFSLAHGTNKYDFCWLQENTILPLKEKKWYAINTFKEHGVFSFNPDTIICVLNIPTSPENINVLLDHMKVN